VCRVNAITRAEHRHVAARAGRLVSYYRKVTIVDEEAAWFAPGDAVPVFHHDDLTYGIAISVPDTACRAAVRA
jgi:hypothetical protein